MIYQCDQVPNLFRSSLRIYLCCVWFIALVIVAIPADASVVITGVTHSQSQFNPERNQSITVQFKLSEPAQTALIIYDARNIQVVRMELGGLAAGEHRGVWSGRDAQGRLVPAGAYHYTIEATGQAETVIYDLTDITGGKSIQANTPSYDEKNNTVTFTVDNPARVFLRAGIKNAFMFNTLLNAVAIPAGTHTVHWDGQDPQQQISVKGKDNYLLRLEGYQLSDNTLLVNYSHRLIARPQWVEDLNTEQKRQVKPLRAGLNAYAYRAVEDLRDVSVGFQFPDNQARTSQGYPIIKDAVDVRIILPPADMALIESQRAEVVFFLNSELMTENEVSYFPYTWHWKLNNLPAGDYYLTGFVVSYGRQFGSVTQKVTVVK